MKGLFGYGLLKEHKKQSEEVWALGNCDEHFVMIIFHNFLKYKD